MLTRRFPKTTVSGLKRYQSSIPNTELHHNGEYDALEDVTQESVNIDGLERFQDMADSSEETEEPTTSYSKKTYNLFSKNGLKNQKITLKRVDKVRLRADAEVHYHNRLSTISSWRWPTKRSKEPPEKANTLTKISKTKFYATSRETDEKPHATIDEFYRRKKYFSDEWVETFKEERHEHLPYHRVDKPYKHLRKLQLYWKEEELKWGIDSTKKHDEVWRYKNAIEFRQLAQDESGTEKLTPTTSHLINAIKESISKKYNGMEEVQKVRENRLNRYLKNLSEIRDKHPLLSNEFAFKYLTDAIKIVNRQQTVYFSIDCEFGSKFKFPSEIGISIFDPRKGVFSLFPHFNNIHIIVKEYYKQEEEASSKDTFLGGNSLMLTERDAIRFLQTLIDTVFSSKYQEGHVSAAFVFSGLHTDLVRLHRLGIKFPKEFAILDTSLIYSCSHGFRSDTSSLPGMLNRFSIPHSYLHNAGNDAYYTLLLLLKLTDVTFRVNNDVDNYMEDLKYEHDWRVQAHLMEQNKEILKAFEERDPAQYNIYEFSPPRSFSDYKEALKAVYATRYKNKTQKER